MPENSSAPDRSGSAPQGIPADAVSETDLILNLANPNAGAAAPAKHIDPRWQKQYQGLLDFRDYLLDQLSAHKDEAREVQPDPLQDPVAESAASDLLRDYLLGMTSTEQDTLIEVNEAIQRIELGTYGICESTGEPIPAERLAAMPWTRYTVEAQAMMEKQNQAPVHASLGTVPDQPAPPDLPPPDSESGREVGGPAPEGTEKARLSGRD